MNSSSTSDPSIDFCSDIGLIRFSFSVIKGIYILPLSILVLYLGLQRRREQKSFRSLSHSEVFSYHLATVELFWGLGLICNICGSYLQIDTSIIAAGGLYSFTFYGEGFFHSLTCVDRYLAVVHPIVYRRLRNSRGMKIRNISISCAWILSLGFTCFYLDKTANSLVSSMLCFVSLTIIIITYCSFSVLCALIRPGPGEVGGEKKRVDQVKQRAFHTITAILGVLSLWFLGLLSGTAVSYAHSVQLNVKCMVFTFFPWLSIPTSLVSPLLCLHRSGRFILVCRNRE